jgi:hypothetical protein
MSRRRRPFIEFSAVQDWRFAPPPVPARTAVPQWVTSLPKQYSPSGTHVTYSTAKRCVPLLDAMTSGWLLTLPAELHVLARGEDVSVKGLIEGVLSTHDDAQTDLGETVYKLNNPWRIRTSPGVSCLFMPMANHHFPLEPFVAVVDTDEYHHTPVNIPFRWRGGDFDGYLKRGAPYVQVVPFRREEIEARPFRVETDEERSAREAISRVVFAGRGAYRERWWHRRRGGPGRD